MTKSKKNPPISVVMPVYNAEKYLAKSIESILNQTFTNFEFIIVNDGSTDGSWEIIQSYEKKDGRIIAVNQENKGVVATANFAASLARGEYISRTDADDISFDTKLDDLLNCARENPSAIVVVGSIEVMDEHDEFIYRELVPVHNHDIKRALYVRNPIPNGATLVKKGAFDAAGGFQNVFAEDCYLWSQLWSVGEFRGTGTTVYKWRMNPEGLTLSNNQKSIKKEVEYLSTLWGIEKPKYLNFKTIRNAGKEYRFMPGRFGVDYKEVFLNDLAQVALHQVKRGSFMAGIRQLLVLSVAGRSGLKAAVRRIVLAAGGASSRILKNNPSATHEEGLADRSR